MMLPKSKMCAVSATIAVAAAAFFPSLAHAVPDADMDWSPRVVRNLDDLPFDENAHLSSHLFVYAGGPCASAMEAQILRGSINEAAHHWHLPIAVEGEAAEAFFGDSLPPGFADATGNIEFAACPAVCVERGVDAAIVHAVIPERVKAPGMNVPEFLNSFACGRVEFGFVNYHTGPVDIYWKSAEEQLLVHHLLQFEKSTRFITTFIGHRFVGIDPATEEVMMDHVVEFGGVIGIKNHVNVHRERDITQEVRSTMGGEWKKHHMVKRTFSSLGFGTGRLPDDVFASMRAFYYNNRDPPHRLSEEWSGKGLYVNYWETDCNFIQIPWQLKAIWQIRLKELVEQWAGIPLEQTDLYGMRQYETGARLLTHVDRINTHAASLIVNIAQGNLTKPWTVEVYDHGDRLHEVVMVPGDIVYYESAKCLHGRNTPLAGGFYTNLFTHYRPVGDPEWFNKENPEGTPEPLIDVGECNLVGKDDEYSQGAVQCENPAVGPHLSPKMIQATGGEDLYSWWRSVSPPGYFGEDVSTDPSDEL